MDLRVGQVRIRKELEPLGRQLQRAHDDERCLLEGVALTVAEGKLGLVETGHRVAQYVAQRAQVGLGVDQCRHGLFHGQQAHQRA